MGAGRGRPAGRRGEGSDVVSEINQALRDMTEPELRTLFDRIALGVRSQLPPGTLFTLIAFDASGIGQYASNARRGDMIKAVREFTEALEQMEDVTR